ncbi:response regulator [Marinilabiliaceae bacterium JC017]|nr:response regulator [Marinilabiliaceae bacterium JC017]
MKKKLLVIDDKPEIRSLISLFLSKEYEVITTSNGQKAFEWLHEGNFPDCVISDVDMPTVNGETFLSQIKASGVFKDIPVIILSSLQSSKDRIRLLQLGAHDFIVKPFNPEELKIRIEKVVHTQNQ